MQPPRLNLRVHLFAAAFIFGSLQIAAPSLHAQQLVISEIMAVNDSTLADEDGDFSDWIEIWNRGAGSVNLEGWHLTDNPADLTKWTFPAETLEADLLLIVFASQKDQSVTGMPLHTNFKLSGGGEYLALVEPDGSTIAAEFEPAFPALGPDESYGLQFTSTSTVSIVSHGASARSWAPADGSLGTNWTIWGGIDDSSWRQGSTGIGFDSSGSFDPLITTDVEDLMTGPDRGTCYIRIPFFYQSISNLNGVSLDIRYDDGFVAYLNGVELASRNAPGSPQWDSMATVNKDDLTAGNTEQIQVLGADTLLSPGTNLLAIHGLNLVDNPFLKNFLIDPALSGVTVAESLSVLAVPTPGTANGQAAATVNFAPPGGMYSSAPVVELSSDPAGSPVYYSLDGSQPTTNAMLYSAPIVPAGGAQIRARSIESSGLEGPIRSEHFIVLAADLLSFSSDLPLVVIENFGGGDALADGFIPFALEIFEAQGGRTSLTNSAALATRAGVRKRGSSTIGRDKVSYNVEAWNELDDDKTIAPLGMPGEADWILYGPYNFDRAMVRNSLIYELSRQAGPYAVRSRFVELFRNINGGNLSYAEDYRGIYIWMEKIKRDPNRVDIDAISPSDTVEPDISGGYMLKIDRADAGDSGFSAGGQSLLYLDPKESEMETDYVAQAAWLQNYINQFGNALGSTNFQDPATGYAAYFDTVEAIDHFILNEFMTRNPDALELSTYLHKPRSGKFTFGPIWDFDRTMGCADDGRSANPAVWTVSKFAYGWWNNLFDDADFWQGMIDRWQALRGDVLSLSNILSVVDSQSAELQEAEARNFGKWSGIPPRGGSYAAEVDLLRTWLSNRVEWIDDQFLDPPLIVPGSSVFEPGTLLTMSGPGGSTIYYTLDGSDPRGFNGVPAPGASLYSLPFPLNAAAVIVER